jgi:hypothetical protein
MPASVGKEFMAHSGMQKSAAIALFPVFTFLLKYFQQTPFFTGGLLEDASATWVIGRGGKTGRDDGKPSSDSPFSRVSAVA